MKEKTVRKTKKTSEVKNKKGKRNIIVLSTVLCLSFLLIGVLVYKVLFDNNIVGTWKLQSENDSSEILTLNKDHTVSLEIDSIKIDGTYELKDDNIISIDIKMNSNDVLVGEYHYNISSSFTEKILELDVEKKKYKYTQLDCKAPEKISKNVDYPKELIGSWVNSERNLEYEFTKKGIAKLKTNNITITLKYKINDNKISFLQSLGGDAHERSSEYSIIEDKLILNNLEYVKKQV